jgi:hypothetical protein
MDDEDENLAHQLAALEVVDVFRRSKRMPLPDAGLVWEFEQLACELMKRRMTGSRKVRHRRIIAFFGAPPLVMAKVWELLMEVDGPWPNTTTKKHLLWGLHMMKVYASEEVLSANVGAIDEKTYRKWSKLFILELSYLAPEVVSDN